MLNPRRLAALRDAGGPINDVTFSRDGKALFAAGDDGNVWGWDVGRAESPAPLGRPLADHRGPVYDQALVGDHIVAAAGADGRVSFWDVSDVHRPRRLGPAIAVHSGGVIDMNVARDVNRMATAEEDKTIRLWDMSPLLAPAPDDVRDLACARAGGGLGEADWATYVPDVGYRRTC
jgi:WD40 repeat protein